MERKLSFSFPTIVLCVLTVFLWISTGVPAASAQFGLPKIPKLPKVGKKESKPSQETAKKKASDEPAPELVKINPDSAPPGGSGELVLSGKNFFKGMQLRIGCPGGDAVVENVNVESPERAVAQINVPSKAQEGPCEVYAVRYSGEVSASSPGSPEVTQMKPGESSFSISQSSPMPVAVSVVLLAEGDLDFMALMTKMQDVMKPSFGAKGGKTRLLLSPDAVKYLQGDKTVFAESPSGLTAVEDMSMMGESTGIFRLAFKNGKIYNFMGTPGGSSSDAKQAYEVVKKKLGK